MRMYWKDETRNNAVFSKLSVSSLSTLTSGSSYLKERVEGYRSAFVERDRMKRGKETDQGCCLTRKKTES